VHTNLTQIHPLVLESICSQGRSESPYVLQQAASETGLHTRVRENSVQERICLDDRDEPLLAV
jgi:hypothetical protein